MERRVSGRAVAGSDASPQVGDQYGQRRLRQRGGGVRFTLGAQGLGEVEAGFVQARMVRRPLRLAEGDDLRQLPARGRRIARPLQENAVPLARQQGLSGRGPAPAAKRRTASA